MRVLKVRKGLSLSDVSQYHLCHTVSFQLCFLSGSRDEVSAGKRWTADQLWEKGSVCSLLQENWSTKHHSFCRCIKTALDKVITVKWRSKPGVTCSFWFPLLSDFMSGLVKSEPWLTGRCRTGQRRKRRIYNLAQGLSSKGSWEWKANPNKHVESVGKRGHSKGTFFCLKYALSVYPDLHLIAPSPGSLLFERPSSKP